MLYGRSLSLYKRAAASAARSYLLPYYLIGTGITNTFVLLNNVLNRINSSSLLGIDSFCKTVDRPCFLSLSQFRQSWQRAARHFLEEVSDSIRDFVVVAVLGTPPGTGTTCT